MSASTTNPSVHDEKLPKTGDTIHVRTLRIGMHPSQNICDQNGVLLLAAGTQITKTFLAKLAQRGITTLRIVEPPQGIISPPFDDATTPPPIDPQRPRLPIAEFRQQALAGLKRHTHARSIMSDVCTNIRQGRGISGSGITDVVEEFQQLTTLDMDLLPLIVSMQKSPEEYLFDHCVNVAMLSMTMAVQISLARESVLEIGLGGLLQDIGMLDIPDEIRLAPRPLSHAERATIQGHPARTLDLLEKIEGLPTPARFIGYQTHERIDGSGYPRGRTGMYIHPYATIVAVADAYSAMMRPRPYRESIPAHEAIRQILIENSHNRFERTVVRSLLDCLSVFGIGTMVQLSDGRKAKVVRANPGRHTQPVIAEFDGEGNPTGSLIDLAQESAAKVSAVIAPANE